MMDSTGSSPFVERPASPESARTQVLSFKYKMSSMQNEFEIEKLALQREVTLLDKKYRGTLDELEKAIDDTKYLYTTNGELETRVRTTEQELLAVTGDRDAQITELSRRISRQDRELNELRTSSQSEISLLENKFKNAQIEADGSKTLLKRYESEVHSQSQELRQLQAQLAQRNDEVASLKASRVVMAHHNYSTEELTELSTLNSLLKEQMLFSQNLERANLEQANELKKLRLSQEAQKFLQSENEKLRRKTAQLKDMEVQIQDFQLENVNLQSQLSFWNEFTSQDGTSQKKPDEVVKEWSLLKRENIRLVNDNSRLQLDINNVRVLNDEMALERNQLLDLNKNYETSILNLKKLNYEIDQQKLLSFEECKILRRQLNELIPLVDDKQSERLEDNGTLEELVDNYRNKTQDLTNELKKLNDELMEKNETSSSHKRRKTGDDVALKYSQRLNELHIENLELKRELTNEHETISMLESKLAKINTLDERRIRILQLRNSPFIKDQFVKQERLQLLLKENEDLKQNGSATSQDAVPRSMYERIKFDSDHLEHEIFRLNKKITRLREVFNKKSLEFIEVVNSLLGFKVEFQSDGKVKLNSCYKPEKYLLADLNNNSLKSNLQSDIEDWDTLLKQHVFDQGQMPSFLATVTLKLWEQSANSKP
ncbi:LADA_0D00694g1_1 [Lachancea dasiensis]|uniref:Spindle assembly checkpoint component MAD1 n=1 Tax=Lachancea dasiensis TaxID=1072105 RepID=A0A1G4J3I1_9SACH|nr:LADA_0D00694g1_1 [Lachancea dasiensis]